VVFVDLLEGDSVEEEATARAFADWVFRYKVGGLCAEAESQFGRMWRALS
jgi:hypothetical protein